MTIKRFFGRLICNLSVLLIAIISVFSLTAPKEVKAAQSHVSVLFLGNSITYAEYYNPYGIDMFINLVKGSGRSCTVDYIAYSSERLNTYANPNTSRGQLARNKISSRSWDYIVLQQHTDYAMADPKGTVGAISTLANYIHSNCPSAKILLNSTLAYSYTLRNEYDGRYWSHNDQRLGLMVNYEMAARLIGGTVVYSGEVNEKVWSQVGYPYLDDGNHPNSYGAFANACAVYKTIFNESPAKSSYNGGLGSGAASKIKNIAASVNCASVSGLAPQPDEHGEWYYYTNGRIDQNMSTVTKNINGWWRVNKGKVDFDCNTIEHNSAGWWKITNGKVDFGYNGIGYNSNGCWFVTNGRVTGQDNGVLYSKSDKNWYYVKNSYISTTYNSVRRNQYGWWAIINGKVDFGFTGMAQNEAGWWRIENGKVNFNYRGFSHNQYGWWYLENGTVSFKKNDVIYGKVDGRNGWWHVVRNKVTFDTGLAKNSNGWWYIKDGMVDFGYTGIGTNSAGTWRIENGKVNFGYNGTLVIDGIEYRFSNGKVISSHNLEPETPEPTTPEPTTEPETPEPTIPEPTTTTEPETVEPTTTEPETPEPTTPEATEPEATTEEETP